MSKRSGFLVLSSVVATLVAGVAMADPISNFLVGRASGSRAVKIWNPTGYEFFALTFVFDDPDTLDYCEGAIIPAKGVDNSDVLVDTGGSSERDYFETIAVPTEGSHMGAIKTGQGVGMRFNKAFRASSQEPGKWTLPKDSDLRDDMISCACDELSDAALPPKLLRVFGIKC
jgi:hypothetical protein